MPCPYLLKMLWGLDPKLLKKAKLVLLCRVLIFEPFLEFADITKITVQNMLALLNNVSVSEDGVFQSFPRKAISYLNVYRRRKWTNPFEC